MTNKTHKLATLAFTLAFLLTGCARFQDSPPIPPGEPSETPIESPVETPVESPLETPVETPVVEEDKEPVITTEKVTEEVKIPFNTVKKNDETIEKGKTTVSQKGIDGTETVTYEVTYTDGVETGRKEVGREVTKKVVEEVVKVGVKVIASAPAPAPAPAPKQNQTPTPAPSTPKPAPTTTPTPATPKPEPIPTPTKPAPSPTPTPTPTPTPAPTPAPAPSGVTIPDGTGMDVNKFINSINANMSYQMEYAYHDAAQKDTIIKMVSPPGVYPENSVIKLRVSEGKEPVQENPQANGLNLPSTYPSSVSIAHENEVVRLLNEYRVANGLNALEVRSDLVKSARYKSDSMLQYNYFAHENPHLGGIGFSSLLYNKFGYNHYSGIGENLQSGYGTSGYNSAEKIMTLWKNSPGHNANMLNPDWKYVGVGIITSKTSGTQYKGYPAILSTQHFGR